MHGGRTCGFEVHSSKAGVSSCVFAIPASVLVVSAGVWVAGWFNEGIVHWFCLMVLASLAR